MEGKVQGSQNINWWVENRQGDVKNSIGHGEAKELICITHRHVLGREFLEGMGIPGREGKRREKRNNSNSIINKMFLKIIKKIMMTSNKCRD